MNNFDKKINKISQQMLACTNMLKGSLTSVCINCNRAKCICKNPTSSKAYRLTYKDKDQKTKTIYVSNGRLDEVKKMIDNFKRCRDLMEEMIAVNIEKFKNG